MAKRQQLDRNVVEYALRGIEAGIEKLQSQAAELRRWLGRKTGNVPRAGGASRPSPSRAGGEGTGAADVVPRTRRRRTMSAEARKRIGDAQRKRWAAQRAKRQEEQSGGAAAQPAAAKTPRKGRARKKK